MSDKTAFEVEINTDELFQMFEEIDPSGRIVKRMINHGLSQGGKIISEAAKKNLSSVSYKGPLPSTDYLALGVSMGLWRKTRGATIGLYMRKDTVSYKGVKLKNPSYINRWINSGTAVRKTSKGYNRGRMEARPFFNTAVSANVNAAAERVSATIAEDFNKLTLQKR